MVGDTLETVSIYDYDFLYDSYTGGGGYLEGTYIIPHPREDTDKLLRRRRLSYYSNFVKPVVDSLTNPIFRKEIARDWGGGNNIIGDFQQDVDRFGNTMNSFMKQCCRMAKLYGSVFVFVDNDRTIEAGQKSAIEKRQYPYLYIIKPENVTNYKCDSSGVIREIEFKCGSTYSKSFAGYKVMMDTDTWKWTPTDWQVTRHDGVVEKGKNNLGFIPVVPVFGTEHENGDLLPLSPMISIARTNLTIYNLSSELRELLRNQAFSILCYPVTEGVPIDKALSSIKVGTNDMLLFDGEVGARPFFIAPEASQAQLLQSEIQRLIDDVYRQASLSSVTAVETKASGVAKQWDFENTNQVLADMAENLEVAEKKIMKYWSAYFGEEIDYKVIYPRDFGIVDIASELDNVARALELNVGVEFNKQARIKAVEAYLTGIPDDEYDAVINEIRNDATDRLMSELSQKQLKGRIDNGQIEE